MTNEKQRKIPVKYTHILYPHQNAHVSHLALFWLIACWFFSNINRNNLPANGEIFPGASEATLKHINKYITMKPP